jgi:hypothetical protein
MFPLVVKPALSPGRESTVKRQPVVNFGFASCSVPIKITAKMLNAKL